VPDGNSTPKPEDDGPKAQEAAEEVVRPAGQEEIPNRHSGEGGEREGALDPAVPQGSDQQVDAGSNPRRSESSAEAEGLDLLHIHLDGPTAYADYPAIPPALSAHFKMRVLGRGVHPTILHPKTNPADYEGDLVSDTIRALGVWDVPGTLVLLDALHAATPGTQFMDFGCHVGWFSLLALGSGRRTYSFDGDLRCLQALSQSITDNALVTPWSGWCETIDDEWDLPFEPPNTNLIVKIDVEGAERYVVERLWPLFEDWSISVLVMEVTSAFESYYPDLLDRLVALGYYAYAMPPKVENPIMGVKGVKHWLTHHGQMLHLLAKESRRGYIESHPHFDVVLFNDKARWCQ
jgi:hypothetical protein